MNPELRRALREDGMREEDLKGLQRFFHVRHMRFLELENKYQKRSYSNAIRTHSDRIANWDEEPTSGYFIPLKLIDSTFWGPDPRIQQAKQGNEFSYLERQRELTPRESRRKENYGRGLAILSGERAWETQSLPGRDAPVPIAHPNPKMLAAPPLKRRRLPPIRDDSVSEVDLVDDVVARLPGTADEVDLISDRDDSSDVDENPEDPSTWSTQ